MDNTITHNQRAADEQYLNLFRQYQELKNGVDLLRRDFDDHKELDEKTHAKMLAEMDALKIKIDSVLQILMSHVTAEETKFDVQAIKVDNILQNQEQFKDSLTKLTVDTAPAVAATRWAQYTGVLVKFIKDTIAPLVIGGAAVYLYLQNKGFF